MQPETTNSACPGDRWHIRNCLRLASCSDTCLRGTQRCQCARTALQVCGAGSKALRDRISSVKNTKKITDAMKLVAAAKVRRAQDAVVNGRPFSENLVKVCFPPAHAPAHPRCCLAVSRQLLGSLVDALPVERAVRACRLLRAGSGDLRVLPNYGQGLGQRPQPRPGCQDEQQSRWTTHSCT